MEAAPLSLSPPPPPPIATTVAAAAMTQKQHWIAHWGEALSKALHQVETWFDALSESLPNVVVVVKRKLTGVYAWDLVLATTYTSTSEESGTNALIFTLGVLRAVTKSPSCPSKSFTLTCTTWTGRFAPLRPIPLRREDWFRTPQQTIAPARRLQTRTGRKTPRDSSGM